MGVAFRHNHSDSHQPEIEPCSFDMAMLLLPVLLVGVDAYSTPDRKD